LDLEEVEPASLEPSLADRATESQLLGALVAEVEPAIPAVKVEDFSPVTLGAGRRGSYIAHWGVT
jgi:hypothetical protein